MMALDGALVIWFLMNCCRQSSCRKEMGRVVFNTDHFRKIKLILINSMIETLRKNVFPIILIRNIFWLRRDRREKQNGAKERDRVKFGL